MIRDLNILINLVPKKGWSIIKCKVAKISQDICLKAVNQMESSIRSNSSAMQIIHTLQYCTYTAYGQHVSTCIFIYIQHPKPKVRDRSAAELF